MRKIIVTGFSIAVAPNIRGVQRVCREFLLRLDRLLEKEELEVEYIYQKNAKNIVIQPEEFHNIKAVAVKRPFWARKFLKRIWLSVILKRQVHKSAVGCCLSHEVPFGERNISFIHDLRPVFSNSDTGKFKRAFIKYLKICEKHTTLALTGSDYQNELIRKYFGWSPERVKTVYLGWEHIKNITSDERIFDKYPDLREREYYYTLSSFGYNKNFQWFVEVSKRHPELVFVVSGSAGGKMFTNSLTEDMDKLSNLVFLGRVTDEENKALIEHCKAFLFPSKFEGFGIPPLEALACGAEVACSNATCLPEIYEDCVRYFDPDDYEVDLDKLMEEPVSSPEKILKKCSWEIAARQFLDALKEEASK